MATLKQLFSKETKREGKIRFTHLAVTRMHEYTLSENDLLDVFRYGEEVRDNMIIRKYPSCTIGITVKEDHETGDHVIITCWKK